MVDKNVVEDFLRAIQPQDKTTDHTYNATVTKVDKDGTVWVQVAGSDKETPTSSTSSEVKRGDAVNVQWRNNKLYIAGNYSNPSAGSIRVNAVEVAAQVANQAASQAITDAGVAKSAASEARAIVDDLESDVVSLESRVSTAENNITTVEGNITSLNGRVTTAEGNITSLGGRVTTAEGKVTTIEGDITSLGNRVTTAEGNITTAEGNITDLQGRVTTAEDDITAIEGDVSDLQSDVTTAQGNITDLQGRVSTAENDISSVEGDITSLGARVTTAEGKITTAEGNITSIGNRVTTAEGKITTAESNITSLGNRITTAEGSITTAEGDITNLQGRIADAEDDIEDVEAGLIRAQEDIQAAADSAEQAGEYAARALGNLSTVQNVTETLNWITAHGTMTLTSDVALDPTHVYFVRDNDGDYHVGSYYYSVVTDPKVDDIATYYELSIDESLNNYVATHLAVDSEGLWIIPDGGGNRVLIATGNGSIYTTAGTYIIGKVNNVDTVLAQFTANGATIGQMGFSHSVIDSEGQRLYASNGTTLLSNIGYDIGNTESGTTKKAPYYAMGSRTDEWSDIMIQTYDQSVSYRAGEIVSYNGNYYIKTVGTNSGIAPTNTTYWAQFPSKIIGNFSFTAGEDCLAVGACSSAIGKNSIALGYYSHAIGGTDEMVQRGDNEIRVSMPIALGDMSYSEGYATLAGGDYSHAESKSTRATGIASHSEGGGTTASGDYSHAEGYSTTASGNYAHAQGYATKARQQSQSVIGKYNDNQNDTIFEIGNGTSGSALSNAFTVDWSGNVEASGDVTDGTGNVLSNKADTSSLATVATSGSYTDLTNKPTLFSGDYNDLTNKPTIPTVNNATLTIQKNGSTVKTFTANASSNVTANITVPTKVSDLTNDSGYITGYTETDPVFLASAAHGITSSDITNWNGKSNFSGSYNDLTDKPTLFSGNYNDLTNKPTIPTVNNATLTIQKNGTNVETFTANASANKTANITVPTKVSDLTNDSGFIVSPNVPYCTCATAAGTAAKTTTIVSGTFNESDLVAGAQVLVKFTNANTVASPTLKIGSTTAKAIRRYGTTAPSTSAASSWNAGAIVLFVYDGTYWFMENWINTTYSSMTVAEYEAGTGTTARLITPERLKAAIETWADSALQNIADTADGVGVTGNVEASGDVISGSEQKNLKYIGEYMCLYGNMTASETTGQVSLSTSYVNCLPSNKYTVGKTPYADDLFSESGGVITIKKSGRYRVSGQVYIYNGFTVNDQITMSVTYDDVAANFRAARARVPYASAGVTCSADSFLNSGVGHTIGLQARNDTAARGKIGLSALTRLMIECLGIYEEGENNE